MVGEIAKMDLSGAGGRTRTGMGLPPTDFLTTSAFAAALAFVVWTIPSPCPGLGLGAARLVSTPSGFRRLGSGLPAKASPNLSSSTHRISPMALKFGLSL